MRNRSKLLLTALTSALLLSLAVSSASARNFSVNEQRIRQTYAPLSFVPSFGTTVRCPVTLEGTLHSRTNAKAAGTLLGYINSVTVGTCESGRARANTETLPWHIQYGSFTGTLPTITTITHNLIRSSFEIDGEIFGIAVRCRFTPASQPGIITREARGVVTGLRADESVVTRSETEGCPSGRLSGTGRLTTSTGGNIIVTLI